MNNKIKEHLIQYAQKNGWDCEENDDFIEILKEADSVYSEIGASHRWYDDMFIVVSIDGILIGYDWYHITGDNSAADMGLKFDLESVCEVEEKEKTIKYYEPIES
jgi:hypothetical protein